jgi:hypothetical protein
MNASKFATGQILRKPVEVVKGRIFLAGWAQKSPEPWTGGARNDHPGKVPSLLILDWCPCKQMDAEEEFLCKHYSIDSPCSLLSCDWVELQNRVTHRVAALNHSLCKSTLIIIIMYSYLLSGIFLTKQSSEGLDLFHFVT